MTNSSQTNAGTVSAATTTVAHNCSNASLAPSEKSAKFTRVDFKRWQQKMFFYLTTLSLQKFISANVPVMSDETPTDERFLVTEAWTHSDFLCKNYILSGMKDNLYNVYNKMIDSKTVVTQVQELQVIIHDLLAEGINLFNAMLEILSFPLILT